jgi:hypothetical protein
MILRLIGAAVILSVVIVLFGLLVAVYWAPRLKSIPQDK